MTTLCVGDSHVRRLERFIDARQPPSVTYGIGNLEQVDYYGISGGLVSNNSFLPNSFTCGYCYVHLFLFLFNIGHAHFSFMLINLSAHAH